LLKEISGDLRDQVVKFAWHDRTSFDRIYDRFGLSESEVVQLMRRELKKSSFKRWRMRVKGRKAKHRELIKVIQKKKNLLYRMR
jgi:uncharacterized protein (TIGR03643 family)